MFEAKITIDAPELAASINNLATALNNTVGAIIAAKAVSEVKVSAADPASYSAPENVAPASTTPTVQVAEAAKATQPEAEQAQPVKTYTLDDLSRAGAELIDQGKMPQLIEILKKNGVQAITQLKPEQYNAVAAELNALGANL